MTRAINITPTTVLITLVAAVALSGGTAYATSQINGKDIKPNTVTGKQIKESTLAIVPDAKRLGGHPAKSFALATVTQASGFVRVPADGKLHTVFKRAPVTWRARCAESGGVATMRLYVYASPDASFATTGGGPETITKSGLQIDNYSLSDPVNSLFTYSIVGADQVAYAGTFVFLLNTASVPCAMSITATG